jgi:hypothetical protein
MEKVGIFYDYLEYITLPFGIFYGNLEYISSPNLVNCAKKNLATLHDSQSGGNRGCLGKILISFSRKALARIEENSTNLFENYRKSNQHFCFKGTNLSTETFKPASDKVKR